jgi:hypothetical protein
MAMGSIIPFNSLAKECIKRQERSSLEDCLFVIGGFMRKIIAFVLLMATPVAALAGDGWIDEKSGGRPRPRQSVPAQPR